MLTVISPAKRLDWAEPGLAETEPRFRRESHILAGHMRQLSLTKLKALMGLSDDLARLNRDRFRDFAQAPSADGTRPAIRAFAGDTYIGLDAATLGLDALDWAQDRLRILSGLYGLLRPRDAIQPYRLEMGSRLKTRRGNTLYAFWGDTIAAALADDARAVGARAVLNCASQEYFGAVPQAALGLEVITPAFLEVSGDDARMVSFFAKRARGAMARWAIDNRITNPADLPGFDRDGYCYDAARSSGAAPVFTRMAQAAA
ncbi:MAG: peroxide stress protein YaaA [Pseudomonadota bacterium]